MSYSVGIGIVTYNREKILLETIQSLPWFTPVISMHASRATVMSMSSMRGAWFVPAMADQTTG